MNRQQLRSLIAIIAVILIGAGVAFSGSQGSARLGNLPVFAIAVGISFLIQWLGFIPAFIFQTEKFYDITGTFTYITVTLFSLLSTPSPDARGYLVAGLVLIWTLRLGIFLFSRVLKSGKDDRFDDIKPSFLRFLNAWTIQGLWVVFTAAAALITITSSYQKPLDIFAIAGLLIWIFGFTFEVIADNQKNRFREDPANKGRFISEGLWSISRHPNYFGEIVLWLGIAIIALPVLRGWQWVAMISPVFVIFLLTRISGVPMLEKKADQKWGGQEEYEAYKAATPVLVPRLKGSTQKGS